MEELYKKLYNKYINVKAKKESEFDRINRDQEVKFINFAEAADECIEHLKSENDVLKATINELRNEVSSLRSAKDQQYVDYEELLSEERQKNQQLCLEIKRLQEAQHSECSEQLTTPQSTQLVSDGKAHQTSRHCGRPPKRPRASNEDQFFPSSFQDPTPRALSADGTCVVPLQQPLCMNAQPDCRRRGINNAGLGNCIFHDLVEYLVGMKVSVVNQSEGLSLCIVHQASGYSFSLTWVDKASSGETELLYRVSSLGTFERVAPEWMRDVILFSMGMCPVFFSRVSRVIKT
ncbi:hypothetical protein Dimus_011761 [Dionaea muscipula]